jgi:DNA-binding GntR family transcriptional regulator
MVFKLSSSPFGGRTRTRALTALSLLRSSYPRELARVLGVSLTGVRKALAGLELDGLVAGRAMGRTRVYEFDAAYFARREFQQYVARLAEADAELRARVSQLRRRPRRSGKPLSLTVQTRGDRS